MLGTIIVNVYGTTLVIDVGTELGYLYGPIDGYNDDKSEGLLLGGSLRSTDGKVHGSDEGIKLRSTDGKVIGTTLRNLDGITLGIDVGTELGS